MPTAAKRRGMLLLHKEPLLEHKLPLRRAVVQYGVIMHQVVNSLRRLGSSYAAVKGFALLLTCSGFDCRLSG